MHSEAAGNAILITLFPGSQRQVCMSQTVCVCFSGTTRPFVDPLRLSNICRSDVWVRSHFYNTPDHVFWCNCDLAFIWWLCDEKRRYLQVSLAPPSSPVCLKLQKGPKNRYKNCKNVEISHTAYEEVFKLGLEEKKLFETLLKYTYLCWKYREIICTSFYFYIQAVQHLPAVPLVLVILLLSKEKCCISNCWI